MDSHVGILDVLDTAGQVSEYLQTVATSSLYTILWSWPSPSPLQDEFTAMREQYMRGGEGFILVYSVTQKKTFDELRGFREMIGRVRNYDTVPMVIVGNKRDLEKNREVSTREGELMAKEFNCPFFETSAALRQNVDEVFYEIVRCIRAKETADYYAKEGKPKSKGGSGGLLCCISGDSAAS